MMRYLLLAAVLFVAACETVPTTAVSTPPKPSGTASAQGSVLNCEVKNGPTGCQETNAAAPRSAPAPEKTARVPQFQPYECQTGMGGMAGFWGHLGHTAEWQAYCEDLERQQASTAAPRAAGPQSTAAGGTEAGGGCVWKGRSYQPGDTIHYQRDGDIYMRDVMINGRPFYTTAGPGQGLSRPDDRAQMCECQRSVKHWACV